MTFQIDLDRLNKIWSRTRDPSYLGMEAAIADRLLTKTMATMGLDVADLEIVLVNRRFQEADDIAGLFNKLRDEAHSAREEVAELRSKVAELSDFITQNHDNQAVRKLVWTANKQAYAEFEELVFSRVYRGRSRKGWEKEIAAYFMETEARLRLWKSGRAIVPVEVMETLRALPPLKTSKLKVTDPTDKLDIEKWRGIMRLVFGGVPQSQVALRVEGVTPSQVRMAVWGRTAPPDFRIVVHQDDRPLDWWELWEMSSNLNGGRQWKAQGLARLGSPDVEFNEDPNKLVDRSKLREMREDYWERSAWGVFVRETKNIVQQAQEQDHGDSVTGGPAMLSAWDHWRALFKRNQIPVRNEWQPAFTQRYNDEFGLTFTKRSSEAKAKPIKAVTKQSRTKKAVAALRKKRVVA